MAGPARPQQHFELDEDIRPLTASGSGRAARRRHLGPSSTGEACSNFFRGKSIVILGLITMGAVYMLGKEKGQSLRIESQLDEVEGKKPTPDLTTETETPTYQPSYNPTGGTDPPVPTYDPTKAGTLPPTPRPTWGDAAYIPDPNPYIDKFNTTEWREFLAGQWEERYQNSIQIREKFGTYCPADPLVPMCPALNDDQVIVDQDWNTLLTQGPTLKCIETGDKTATCGIDNPWLNKTIWPLIRGQFCAIKNNEKQQKFPMPDELLPYHELGYDRADPTKSVDAAPFDGGSASQGLLWFDANKVKDHFLKFEAMLEHYYEGLSRTLLESAIKPAPESSLYAPMLQQYADQIARALLRRKENGETDDGIVIGVLGDSVTSGTDNCYFDAWPEQLRRQMAPIFESIGVKLSIRNAAKNGGWLLAPQMLCANDMLGASDRDVGLDFLFTVNPFVHANAIDAEHFIRRALFGPNPTLVSLTGQDNMDIDAFVNKYATAGFIYTTEPMYQTLTELHFPIPGHSYWFPDPGRGFWGMQSDGFCRLTTRAGSSPVVKRNWHWGPLIHQSYADAMGLLFSRAARMAIDNLAAGRSPPDPPSIDSYERLLDESYYGEKAEQVYKKFLISDMESNDYSNEGLAGVHCAVGTANQPGSTLLRDWLKPAAGSPFEATMNARGGVSYVPDNHLDVGGTFYRVAQPISNRNEAVEIGDWVQNPTKFSEEAPRTSEQCMHVDGSTMINWVKPEGVSWVVWKVPERSVSVGRLMICQQRGPSMPIAEDAFDTQHVRFHYAVSDASGNWKVVEDTQKNENKQAGDDCIVMVNDMDADDKAAAWTSGLWVAVEWAQEGIFDFDYLVAM